jgi:hypothetical protein
MNEEASSVARYRERLGRLARVLYDRDPHIMGSLIGTPEDEYAPLAEMLMPRLTKVGSRDECTRVLAEHSIHDDRLIDDIWRIFAE